MTYSAIERVVRPVVIENGVPVQAGPGSESGRNKTISNRILSAHSIGGTDGLYHIKFDAMISHDITYVGITQTARASGLKKFPMPYAFTNCHNSLCAVGGTINQDDHLFGLSAAKKYGGIYVPANLAVIHEFAREEMAGCGKMIMGSDSHTRYGCYGTMGVGEGGGELVKQLVGDTWDIQKPQTVLIWLEGTPPHGVGPHDAAIALTGAVFPDGFVKNRVLEFAGPGIASLPMDWRIGIDVMTTETGCLSSIWETDEETEAYYRTVGRPQEYRKLSIEEGAYYDRMVRLDLSKLEPMIAMPFHPSNAYTVKELQNDPENILHKTEKNCNSQLKGVKLDLMRNIGRDGKIRVEQGLIVGCAGGMYGNISEAADILRGKSIGNGYFDLSVYPSSAPIELALIRDGIAADLLNAGAVLKPAFCGPCFGAGDTPANQSLSIRHATRNFPNREGSKPSAGQIAAAALMDARSIAATAAAGGVLTSAMDVDYEVTKRTFMYDRTIYEKRCYFGYGKADPTVELRLGPNIKDWPKMPALEDNLLVKFCAVIEDEVTTTDELIPSGETSSYRSNPEKLSEFALSRRVPEYVSRSKAMREEERNREAGRPSTQILDTLKLFGTDSESTTVGSCIFARKPGDGSAREQAASCQKVLGGFANVAYEYATKRYRSNCINWGIIPFTVPRNSGFTCTEDTWLFVPGIRKAILGGAHEVRGILMDGRGRREIYLSIGDLTDEERQILADGCLINYYSGKLAKGGE
ncbi:MAG: hydratase [Oscillospiraceae bacterium]|jgi:aconitate hydratase